MAPEESNSGIWLPHMMNITPHATFVGRQPTFWLIVPLNTLGGGGWLEFWTHGSDAEDIAQVNAARLHNAFRRRQGEVPVGVHHGIQQRRQVASLLRPGLQQHVDLAEVKFRLKVIFNRHGNTGRYWP